MMSINDATTSSLQTRMAKIMRMQGGGKEHRMTTFHISTDIYITKEGKGIEGERMMTTLCGRL